MREDNVGMSILELSNNDRIQIMNVVVKTFKEKVLELEVVRKISRRKTLTYKQVAKLAGKPKAYRAVGNILNTNYNPKIPCHRVIRSDGKIGGYNRGIKNKIKILRKEGAV